MNRNRHLVRSLSIAALWAACSSTVAGAARADGSAWQQRMLFEPSEQQLRMEARGRVMIYDGLTDLEVRRALDEQFERVEHMMFVRTVRTDPGGAPLRDEAGALVVDDDC